jgi:hypothetical protein
MCPTSTSSTGGRVRTPPLNREGELEHGPWGGGELEHEGLPDVDFANELVRGRRREKPCARWRKE